MHYLSSKTLGIRPAPPHCPSAEKCFSLGERPPTPSPQGYEQGQQAIARSGTKLSSLATWLQALCTLSSLPSSTAHTTQLAQQAKYPHWAWHCALLCYHTTQSRPTGFHQAWLQSSVEGACLVFQGQQESWQQRHRQGWSYLPGSPHSAPSALGRS